MNRQYWGTFSIYDHRADYYRPSLLLFDRVVMPVPTHLVGSLTNREELEQLESEAKWLEEQDCAVYYKWDPGVFADWQAKELNASAATFLSTKVQAASRAGDAQLNTRYQLQWLVDSGVIRLPDVSSADVTTMPVFESRQAYVGLEPERLDIDAARQATLELIIDAFPVPAPDTPLEQIIDLRERDFIGHQMGKLRAWQLELIEDLVDVGDNLDRWNLRLERAQHELRNAIADYEHAMAKVIENRHNARFTTLFSVLRTPDKALGRVFTEHRDDFHLLGNNEYCWKALYDQDHAFAGVICTAE
jgi:hypothetical protein